MATQDDRREVYLALCKEHGLETANLEHYSNSGEEDAAEYLHDGKEIGRYVLETRGGEYTYLAPYASVEEAQRASTEYIADDIYAEAPIALYDLDERTCTPVAGFTVIWGDPRPWKEGGGR